MNTYTAHLSIELMKMRYTNARKSINKISDVYTSDMIVATVYRYLQIAVRSTSIMDRMGLCRLTKPFSHPLPLKTQVVCYMSVFALTIEQSSANHTRYNSVIKTSSKPSMVAITGPGYSESEV